MALTMLLNQREFDKFRQDGSNRTFVAVGNPDGSAIGSSIGGGVAGFPDNSVLPSAPTITPVGGVYRSAATSYGEGDAVILNFDVNGNLLISKATLDAGELLTRNLQDTVHRVTPSTKLSASGVVSSSAGEYYGLQCVTSSSLVYDIHDHASFATGTKIMESVAAVAGVQYVLPVGITVANGIYYNVTSGSGSVIPYLKT